MRRSFIALAGLVALAAVVAPLVFPMPAAAGAFATMGDNLKAEVVRVAGAVIIIVTALAFIPDIGRRNFAGLFLGFLALCLGAFFCVTPERAISVAESVNNTITHGAASGSGSGAPATPSAPAKSGP